MIRWTDEQKRNLARKWIELRIEYPMQTPIKLLSKAQHEIFADNERRKIAQFATIPDVFKEILRLWKDVGLNAVPELVPVEPKVEFIEVPRKLTAAEMLDKIDEPTLHALLAAKKLIRETQHMEIMRGLAARAGADNLPKVEQYIPRLEAFDNGQKHPPRIVVTGIPETRQTEIQNEVKSANLTAFVRFPSGKDQESFSRSDFAIVCRDPSKTHGGNPEGDRAVGTIGRDRVIFIDDSSTGNIVRQVRNLCSRQ